MCTPTNELSGFVLSPVYDALKGLPHDSLEARIATEGFRDDEVYLGLQLEQFLHH